MEEPLNEKAFPIEFIWVFKMLSEHIVFLILILIIAYLGKLSLSLQVLPIFLGLFIIYEGGFIINYVVRRSAFRFLLNENTVSFQQGKGAYGISFYRLKDNLEIKYTDIKEVYVYRGWFEKLLGLEAISIELSPTVEKAQWLNIDGSRMVIDVRTPTTRSSRGFEFLGFMGDIIHIPGLKKEKAEKLRDILLQKKINSRA